MVSSLKTSRTGVSRHPGQPPSAATGSGPVGREAAGMSKARLVITAVIAEKRPVSEVARTYGVARSWVYALVAR